MSPSCFGVENTHGYACAHNESEEVEPWAWEGREFARTGGRSYAVSMKDGWGSRCARRPSSADDECQGQLRLLESCRCGSVCAQASNEGTVGGGRRKVLRVLNRGAIQSTEGGNAGRVGRAHSPQHQIGSVRQPMLALADVARKRGNCKKPLELSQAMCTRASQNSAAVRSRRRREGHTKEEKTRTRRVG